jgi:hypothetical protein
MLSLTRHIFAATILLGIVSTFSTARSQAQADKKERTGSVSGRVTLNGKAAPGVVVSVREERSRTPSESTYRNTTDADGTYRINGVPAGNYRVTPLAPVFILSDSNVSSASGKLLLIAAGEVIEGIDFALVRGGVITGKVTDSEDRPLIEQRVDVVSMDAGGSYSFGHTRWRMDIQTDDRGIYRIFGIPRGRYKVAVGENENTRYRSDTRRVRYRQTFHPDVTDSDKAAIIELAEGAEATNVDIRVSQTLQLYSAKGRIVNGENGQPLADMQVGLTRIFDNGSSSGSSGQKSDPQGEFLIENLTPGKYSVSILTSPESRLHAEAAGFEIVDQDVTGLVIRTSKFKEGVSLAGIVVLEGAQKLSETTDLLHLNVISRGEATNQRWRSGTTLDRDGAFSFESLPSPGPVYFSIETPHNINPRNMNQRYAVSRIERDGVIQPNLIQLQDGEHINGLRIVVVAQRAGVIRGEVKVVNGTLPAGARLLINVKKSGEPFGMSQPEADLRGLFVIPSLPAGSYELSVNAYGIGSQQTWPTVKQLVQVEEEKVTDVTITFDLKQSLVPGPKL